MALSSLYSMYSCPLSWKMASDPGQSSAAHTSTLYVHPARTLARVRWWVWSVPYGVELMGSGKQSWVTDPSDHQQLELGQQVSSGGKHNLCIATSLTWLCIAGWGCQGWIVALKLKFWNKQNHPIPLYQVEEPGKCRKSLLNIMSDKKRWLPPKIQSWIGKVRRQAGSYFTQWEKQQPVTEARGMLLHRVSSILNPLPWEIYDKNI